jgi:lysophospholipase L1-like esterase
VTDIWTTAFLAAMAAPDETLTFIPASRTFSTQTVRQSVRLLRGGTSLRLVLSNEFGRIPLVIDEITVYLGAAAPGLPDVPTLPVLINGNPRWQIPAGATATSDPVALTISAGQELVISCYVASSNEPASYLHSAQRTAEVAPGNQVRRRLLTDPEQTTSLYWITRVLINTPAIRPVVVALGDSVTRGDGTTADLDQRYPDHLQRRLLAGGVDGAVVLNAGLGGNLLLRTYVGLSMKDRFARDVLGVAEASHVVIMAGVNDIALPAVLGYARPAAGDIVDGLLGLAQRAEQGGIQPILGTIIPFGGSSYPSFLAPGNEDLRQAVNHALTTQKDWPVVDFATALADSEDRGRLAPAFDSGDGVHPGDAGAEALADAVDLARIV